MGPADEVLGLGDGEAGELGRGKIGEIGGVLEEFLTKEEEAWGKVFDDKNAEGGWAEGILQGRERDRS